eukprot:TRINITY_DN3476_c0_g1_i1.p1 TRINITY_DN3476_c0_g1~~TRINITY_DN3476_c0_g1_i1.p1  ORF type:complete len:98 (+),score=26.97 TRINITY_DN3476_c0_g1_i1:29-295(+)
MKLVEHLRKLISEEVKIELKDNSVVKGTILAVNGEMNIHLKNVQIKYPNESGDSVDSLTIRGSSIRYIFLPNDLDLDRFLIPKAVKQK